jgi:signal transduction histidine kinase
MNPQTYFIPVKNHPGEKVARQESLVINFTLISLLFGIGYFILSFFNGFLMARYLMVMVGVVFVAQLYAYKFRWLSLRFVTHFFVWVCWVVVVVLSLASYGIHSYVLAWISLIPVMALVLLSNRAAWIWSAIGMLTVLFFAFFEPDHLIPSWLLFRSNTLLTASLHIGLLFIVLTLAYIFDRQQKLLIQKIESQNQELQKSKEETSARNETLVQTQLEISNQRDTVSEQNNQLKAAREIIETQHQILIQKNEGLELEIQQRTKELVEYNQQLEQFAFIASHNLRAPIARILGLGNLLAMTSDTEDKQIIQKELVQSARQLDRVVKDLNMILDVGKSSEKMVMQLDVKNEIELILLNHKNDIAEAHAKITLDVDQVPTLNTSKPYFDSIFTNLVSNAIKYRRPGIQHQIHIEAIWKDGFALFTVRDNGLGIDLQASGKKLFTLYSRFHDRVDGKGIGLFMVKTQLQAQGGKVEVESEVGKGTVFKVYIKPDKVENKKEK